MAKKVKKEEEVAEVAAPVVSEGDVVFANREKHERAQGILALITGKRAAQNAQEEERRDHYRAQLDAREIDPKSKGALQALYEILGGLVRTQDEQAEADENAREMRAGNKKRKVESDETK